MTAIALLMAIVLVDGACSGFRASLGRTGLIHHLRRDRQASAGGVALVIILLAPAGVVAALDIAGGGSGHEYGEAAAAMLEVLAPYASAVALALVAYAVLDWRRRYLAMALVLGPFTLARPIVALAALAVGLGHAHGLAMTTVLLLGTVAVLAVESIAGLAWRSSRRPTLAGRRSRAGLRA